MVSKSRDQLTSLSDLKDGFFTLHFTGDFVSTVSLGHKRAAKLATRSVDSLATFSRLKNVTVLAHAHKYLPTIFLLFGLRM